MSDSVLKPNSFWGVFKDGIVFPESTLVLPNGTKVKIELVDQEKAEEISHLIADMKTLAGTATGLPSDLACNHDHYLHGTPKK